MNPEFSTGWADMLGEVVVGDRRNSLIYEAYRDTDWDGGFMSSALPADVSKLSYRFQFNHDWSPAVAADVNVHIHWEPQADPAVAESVYFSGHFVWLEVGQATPALAGWTAWNQTLVVDPGDVFKPRIDSLVRPAVPVHAGDSTILLVNAIRDFENAADDYDTVKGYGTGQANLLVHSIDAHYWVGKAGSKIEYPGAA